MPKVFIQFLCSVEQEVKLYGKSVPQMWPAVDHTHLLSGLVSKVLMKAELSRPIEPCDLLNNGDIQSLQGDVQMVLCTFASWRVSVAQRCREFNQVKRDSLVRNVTRHFLSVVQPARGVAIGAWFGLVFSFIVKKSIHPTITHTRRAESHGSCLPVQEHRTDCSGD